MLKILLAPKTVFLAVLLFAQAVLPQPARAEEPLQAPAQATAPEDMQELLNRAVQAAEEGDMETALKYLRQASDAGDPDASRMLGLIYEVGDEDYPRDLAKAAEFYRKALAQGGNVVAVRLGYMHLYGRGVPQDRDLAEHLFRRAVMMITDYPRPTLEAILVKTIRLPPPLPPELEEAVRWVQEVQKWDGRRQYELSLQYREGEGVPKDRYMADFWLGQATITGPPEAMYDYAMAVLTGTYSPGTYSLGLVEDEIRRAVGLLWQAAEDGHVPAQKELGLRHLSGDGAKQSDWKAYYWLLQAQQGGADVEDALTRLEAVISEKDRERAVVTIEIGIHPVP